MYAILDIETTGGKYNEEGITEIAIYQHDGQKVVDKFVSLVNPERSIQPFVVGLTGINNEMLHTAPKFYEVAKRIVEITDDCVLVAHNAKFDYRILRTEFDRLGYEFQRKSICTVEVSKKLIPGMPSYSLGKLMHNLGIPVSKRHRAEGDTVATTKLFEILLEKDSQKSIIGKSLRENPKRFMDDKLIRLMDGLPTETGVYYFHDSKGKIIYIGKSNNLKKRVNQHFTSEASKARQIQREVEDVRWELTGNELFAFLKENQEIKANQPKYNRALKRNTLLNNRVFTHALYRFVDEEGYLRLKILPADFDKKPVATFTNLAQAKRVLQSITDNYHLCQKLNGLHKTDGACFDFSIQKCNGACLGKEDAETYNPRVKEVIEKYGFPKQSLMIVDKGRKHGEKSVLLIEDGRFAGIGYCSLNHQIHNLEILKNIIAPMEDNKDARHLIQSYLRKEKRAQIIEIEAVR